MVRARTWIYFTLTVCAGAAVVAGMLNTQFIILQGGGSWRTDRPWELLIVAWGSLIYALGCLALAWLSDRFGRLKCIAATTGLMAAINVALGWRVLGDYHLWHFFAYWFLANLAFAVFFTSVEGLLSDYQDHKVPLARRLGAYCLSWCTGDALAAFLAGFIKQGAGPEAVFRILSLLWAAGCVATLIDWSRHGARKLGEHSIGVADIRRGASFHALLGRIGVFFACLSYTCVSSAFPRYAREFHRFEEGAVGALFSVILFFSVCGFLVLSRWRAWHYRRGWQWALQLPMAAGLGLAILAPAGASAVIVVGFALFGLGWSAAYFFSIYYSLMVPRDHAKSGGIHEAVLGFGNLAGPLAASGLIWLALRGAWMPRERTGVLALAIAVGGVAVSLAVQAAVMQMGKASKTPLSLAESSTGSSG